MSNIEGTILLEGLIEGKLPVTPGAGDKIKAWGARGLGGLIPVEVRIEGQRFSIMPTDRPAEVAKLTGGNVDAQQAIAESLDEMLRIFPPGERGSVFSTLRSREFKPKKEIQSVYAVAPEGRIAVHMQTVDAATEAPPQPLPRKVFWMQLAVSLGIVAVLFLVSTLFVDYGKLFRTISRKVDVSTVTVETRDFAGYLEVDVVKARIDGDAIILKVKRGPNFPLDDAALDGATTRVATSTAPGVTRSRLALEALARGYVKVEMFGAKDEFIGAPTIRIAELRNKESVELEIPMPLDSMKTPTPPKKIGLAPG